MAYAQLITHTPEQVEAWRKIAATDPSRLIRTLRLAPGGRTREGDRQRDIYPAFEVVKEISLEGRNGEESKAWASLVSAGIAEVLCKNVSELVTSIHAPNMPADLLERTKKEIRSPYFAPLEILCNASISFHYPPTKTDKTVIAALRRHWSEMMDRVWTAPENTLEPSDSHIPERMVIAQTVIRLIITDPSFLTVFYAPSDLTLQIIARHWKYSLAEDIDLTAIVLTMFLQPNHPRHIAFVRSNDLESATPQLLSKVLVGASPTPSTSKPKQIKALLAVFADHLVRLVGRRASVELDFFSCIVGVARNDDAVPEIVTAILKSTPFWNAVFRLLRKSAKSSGETLRGQPVDEETETKHRLYVMANVVGITTNVLHDASIERPRECEALARIWANENLFGSIDETVDQLVEITGMTMLLGRLAGLLDTVVTEGTPSLRQLFGTQFPRFRTIGTLIRHDMQRQIASGVPKAVLGPDAPPPNSNIWDHGAWQAFAGLQAASVDFQTVCGKRGEACKTKDAKDHNIACGHMPLLEHVVRDRPRGPRGKTPEKSLPLANSSGSGGKDALEALD
ncbi:hypothetical protein DXG03_004390 [Asterophora parasitica]|uniref:Uncharacterized protein n=1 Tax=Asterophora parasitica TaxID=117018 RepID=A0A9P7G2P8_9AGAR|nr:hypothetical protein DXG03_004390 [Asterophora parasitica]